MLKFVKNTKFDKETMKKIYPDIVHAAIELDDIRCKFLPNLPIVEPNLSFMAKVASGNKQKALQEGLKILRNGSVPVALALSEACLFNNKAIRSKNVARVLGFFTTIFGNSLPNSPEFASELVKWQEKNDLEPDGKLNPVALAHLRSKIPNSSTFPRNFGIVINDLYRGRQPDSIDQLKALKDTFGIRRVITLNEDAPPISDWCKKLGLDHVYAIFSFGAPQEQGWQVIGPNISSFLLETPTFIHCQHGSDRTGGIIACLRTEMGFPCDLAYFEAKSFGFRDCFFDMIDRFTKSCKINSKEHRHPPVDTNLIRKSLGVLPNCEQNLLEPTPFDLHYTTDNNSYESGADTILSPYSIFSIPTGYPGGGR